MEREIRLPEDTPENKLNHTVLRVVKSPKFQARLEENRKRRKFVEGLILH